MTVDEVHLSESDDSEQLVCDVLVRGGWTVERSGARRADGRAPMLVSRNGSLILPDIRATRGGATMFVEVKWQRRVWDVGGDPSVRLKRVHLEHYRRVAETTGIPVVVWWLMPVDERVMAASCDVMELGEPCDVGSIGRDEVFNWRLVRLCPRGDLRSPVTAEVTR